MRKVFTLTPPARISEQLGFRAHAVIVDNLTNQWLRHPATSRYVPPFSHNLVIPISAGAQVAEVDWTTPPGVVAMPVDPTQQATVSFVDAAASQSAQSAFTQPQPHVLLGSLTSVANQVTTSPPIALPTGTQSVLVVWANLTGSSIPTSVALYDGTGKVIWGQLLTGTGVVITSTTIIFAVSTSVSQTVLLQVGEGAGNSQKFSLVGLFTPAAVSAEITEASCALPVNIAQVGSVVVTSPLPVSGNVAVVAPTRVASMSPAAWGPGDAVAKTIIGGVAEQTIRLRTMNFGYVWSGGTGNNTLSLQASGGGLLGQWRFDSSGANSPYWPGFMDWQGYVLPVGQGLVASIGGAPGAGVTVICGGVITYDQN